MREKLTDKTKISKKKLSYFQKQKAIKEMSDSTNRAITRRILWDLALRQKPSAR